MRHLTTLRYIDEVAKRRSIRKAAEHLTITPSALNRRILLFEEELGAPIFERMARGMRLNTAGEILIRHIRSQTSDLERVRSQIADLSGVRRGHVSIACQQALLGRFLSREITGYREDHPAVTFDILIRDGVASEQALQEHGADLAILFESPHFSDFETILTIDQPLYGVMAPEHPLAQRKTLRLSECLEFPLAVPPAPRPLRLLLEALAARAGANLKVAVQSDDDDLLLNCCREMPIIALSYPINLPLDEKAGMRISRPIDPRDAPPMQLYLGRLRDRLLPVAAARFADQLLNAFVASFECT